MTNSFKVVLLVAVVVFQCVTATFTPANNTTTASNATADLSSIAANLEQTIPEQEEELVKDAEGEAAHLRTDDVEPEQQDYDHLNVTQIAAAASQRTAPVTEALLRKEYDDIVASSHPELEAMKLEKQEEAEPGMELDDSDVVLPAQADVHGESVHDTDNVDQEEEGEEEDDEHEGEQAGDETEVETGDDEEEDNDAF